MGFKLAERVFAIPSGFLAPDERLVLLAYAFKADDTYDVRPTAWPSQSTVAAMCGWSSNHAVKNRVKALKAAGWMRQGSNRKDEERTPRGRFRTPVWVLELPEKDWWTDGSWTLHGIEPTEKAKQLASRSARTNPPMAHRDTSADGSPRTTGPLVHPDTPSNGPPWANNQKRGSEEEISEVDISHLVDDSIDASVGRPFDEEDIAANKAKALADLKALEEKWSLEEAAS